MYYKTYVSIKNWSILLFFIYAFSFFLSSTVSITFIKIICINISTLLYIHIKIKMENLEDKNIQTLKRRLKNIRRVHMYKPEIIQLTIFDNDFNIISVNLDEPCRACQGDKNKKGDGKYPYVFGFCEICNGRGYVLTYAGQAIMDLIERYKEKNNE